MAFTQIAKSAMGAHANKHEIRMGSRFQSKSTSTRSIYFAITRAVVAQAGWTIDVSGAERDIIQIAVNEGSEEDAGFLLLSEDTEKGYVFGTSRGVVGNSMAGSVSVTRFRHYVLNDMSQEIEPAPVEFTVDEKEHTILVQCPDWLRYNPLSVPNKPKPPVKEVVAPVAKPTFQSTRKATEAEIAFDELMAEQVVDGTARNRQERRLLSKKVQQHLRR